MKSKKLINSSLIGRDQWEHKITRLLRNYVTPCKAQNSQNKNNFKIYLFK